MIDEELRHGKVRWFDVLSGDGMIRDNETQRTFYVHYSAIDSQAKWRTLDDGADVVFRLLIDTTFVQVEYVKQVGKP